MACLSGLGLETEAEARKKLQECVEPLRQNGVKVDNFTVSGLLELYCLPHQIIKHVRVLTSIPYKDVRDSVLAKANSLGICPPSHEMNVSHVVEVCSWMKTKSGIKAVVEVQRSEKLKRSAIAKGKTVAESAMIRAFNTQLAEYSSELKKARAASQESEKIRDKYWPASVFGITTCLYKDEDAVLEFCKREGVKFGLYKYLEGLIDRKMKNYAIREAQKLQAVLNEMGCSKVLLSSTDGNNCHVGEKRKKVDSVQSHNGETSSESKKVAFKTV